LKWIKDEVFQGERPLFKSHGVKITSSKFLVGESALKESQGLEVEDCEFIGKYPFWHNDQVVIDKSLFTIYSRAAIWYSKNVTMKHSRVEAPKMFRKCENLKLIDVTMTGSNECGWNCRDVMIENSEINGDYLLMNSSDVKADGLKLLGNYFLDHGKNCEIRNSILESKDAFWNSENITVYDSILDGEYLGWYSKNLKLVNCKILGTQPLCYAQNLILENCEMVDTDLCFEYSTLNAEIINTIESIKNPLGGSIKAAGINTIIFDEGEVDPLKCKIVISKERDKNEIQF
jgi:hypothetical protein